MHSIFFSKDELLNSIKIKNGVKFKNEKTQIGDGTYYSQNKSRMTID
jgi:hypothetical protein